MSIKRVLASVSFVTFAGLLAAGCAEGDEATEYVAGFSTQVQVPKEFRTLEYSVRAYSATDPVGVVVDCRRVEVINGKARLPKTLGVHKKTDAPNMMVQVVAYREELKKIEEDRGGDCEQDIGVGSTEGSQQNPFGARVIRRSRQGYAESRILYLPMALKFACFDQKCPDDQSCVGGRCVTMDRNKAVFRDFSPEMAFGDSSTCFSLARCLTDAVTPTLEDPANCTYSVPGTVDGMNVRAIYDGMVTEVLDVDATTASVPGFDAMSPEEQQKIVTDLELHQEGYTIVAPGKFRLAPGLCELTKTNDPKKKKILALAASRSCPPKPPEQPLCDENGEVLIPAPSKLLVLLDRSADMAEVLYPPENNATPEKDPVQLILSLSLDDPVFSNTEVGFKWLPSAAAANACESPQSYTTLDRPFQPALQGRIAIAETVGADRKFSGTRATHTSLQNALSDQGVYGFLDGLADKDKLNLRAVVVLTNGDTEGSCTDPAVKNDGIKAAVSSALGKGIPTYVVQLAKKGIGTCKDAANNDVNQNAPECLDRQSRVTQAQNLLVGQESNFFDATTNDVAATAPIAALSKIVSDLSSCLYDRPGSIADGSQTVLSILGQPDVGFNAGCTDKNSPVDGWNFAGPNQSLIRICGQSCETLKNNTKNLGGGKLGGDFVAALDPTQKPPASSTPPVLLVTAIPKKK